MKEPNWNRIDRDRQRQADDLYQAGLSHEEDVRQTPKPWRVVKNRGNHWGMVEVEGPGVGGRLVVGFTVASNITAADGERIESDARLIAAAPDLLAKAIAVVERWDTPLWKDAEPTANVIGQLRAAISKATGATDGNETQT